MKVLERLDEAEDNIKELGDAVFGDDKNVADGLIKDMRYVRNFIIKWDKREYAWKLVVTLLGSNLVLTILGYFLTLLIGGG